MCDRATLLVCGHLNLNLNVIRLGYSVGVGLGLFIQIYSLDIQFFFHFFFPLLVSSAPLFTAHNSRNWELLIACHFFFPSHFFLQTRMLRHTFFLCYVIPFIFHCFLRSDNIISPSPRISHSVQRILIKKNKKNTVPTLTRRLFTMINKPPQEQNFYFHPLGNQTRKNPLYAEWNLVTPVYPLAYWTAINLKRWIDKLVTRLNSFRHQIKVVLLNFQYSTIRRGKYEYIIYVAL